MIGDRILGVLLLLLAVSYGWEAAHFPEPFGGVEAVGPETFPIMLAIILGFSSLYLIVRPDADEPWPHQAMLVSLNIQPGPMLFTQNADLVWGVIAALFVGNLILLLLNIPMVGVFVKLLSIPPKYLMPVVTLVASVGIFAISNSPLDLYFMIGFGLLGYVLRKLHIPLVPIILGMLLGPEMEKSLRHALTISDGDWTILWSSGLSVGIWIVAIAGLVLPYLIGPILRRRMANEAEKAHAIED